MSSHKEQNTRVNNYGYFQFVIVASKKKFMLLLFLIKIISVVESI